MTFHRGEAVEWDGTYDRKEGCTIQRGQKPLMRGTYVGLVDDVYSDVAVGTQKPLLIRTRLRRSAVQLRSGGGEAA